MPNVSVSNTPGLYIGSGASAVLNNAQQLYALLSNSGNVNFALINNNTAVQSYFIGNAGGGSYGNAEVAQFLPTYTGTLDNSSTIVSLVANAATQSVAITGLDANLGAFQTYANATFGTSSYGNANVAAYLPVYGGTIQLLDITGVPGQSISLSPDGTGDVQLNADTVRVGDNNQDAVIVTHGTGNLTLTTHQGDANQGNITLVDGADGNIKLWPNGSGIVEAAGNVKANYFIGDGSQLTGIPAAYGNTQVAAYLPTYTGSLDNSSSVVNLQANAATQATAINTLDANLGTATTNITTLFSNAATQQTQINTLDANVGTLYLGNIALNSNVGNLAAELIATESYLNEFTNYANIAFNYYDDTDVANFLPVYNGNLVVYDEFVSNTLAVQGYSVSTFVFTSNTSWTAPSGNTIISAKALIIGGGGAGGTASGTRSGGGGGAGGVLANVNVTNSIVPGNTYSIVVGSGGTGGTSNVQLARGQTSSAFGFSANGGGFGGGSTYSGSGGRGGRGGSGGGGYGTEYSAGITTTQGGSNAPAGQGTAGQDGTPNYSNPNLSAIDALGGDGGTLYNGLGSFYVDNVTGAPEIYAYPGPGSKLTTTSGTVRYWTDYGNTNIANPTATTVSTQPATPSAYGSGGAGGGGAVLTGQNGQQGVVIVQLLQRGYTSGGTIINNNTITTGNVTASYFIGDGSQLTNLPAGGTYGNTQVGAYLTSGATAIQANLNKVTSTTGFFWANGTAYSTGGGGGGGSDFTSNLTVNGNYILNGNINLIREKFANIGTLNGVTTIDANVGMIQAAVVASNITINTTNLTNFVPGQTITLKLTQATNTNLRILTSNILYAGGSKTLSTANAAIDTISITWDGEQYLGALVRGYS